MYKKPLETLTALSSMGFEYVEHANYVNRKFYGWSATEFKKVLKNRLTKSLRLPSEVKRISYSFSPASLAAKASLAVEI